MKTMIMPVYNNLMIRPYAENPYIEKKTKSGLLINDDQFKSQDSGEEEKLNELIKCAEVLEVGPECKYVKPGDDIFYNVVTVKPVPFQRQGFLLLSELSVLAIMNDDLEERKEKWNK